LPARLVERCQDVALVSLPIERGLIERSGRDVDEVHAWDWGSGGRRRRLPCPARRTTVRRRSFIARSERAADQAGAELRRVSSGAGDVTSWGARGGRPRVSRDRRRDSTYSSSWRPSPGPSSTATQRMSSVCASTILTIIVSGTESSAPAGPKIQPQTTIDMVTTNGDSPTA